MIRRAFLAGVGSTLGAAVAGCLGPSRPGDGGDQPSGDTATPSDGTRTDSAESGDTGDRVDEPPYQIQRPEPPEDPTAPDDWNELYRCEHMPAEPTIQFEQLSGVRLANPALSAGYGDHDRAYSVRILADASARDSVLDLSGSTDRARERLRGLNFQQHAILVIESGYGSGAIDHHWKRLENRDDEVWLFGCHTTPYEQTDDIDTRSSVIVVERPAAAFDLAQVWLTVSEDRRVHFDSTEGVVRL
jgi:hypothetical protein